MNLDFQSILIIGLLVFIAILLLRKKQTVVYEPPVTKPLEEPAAATKVETTSDGIKKEPKSEPVRDHDIRAIARRGFISAWSKFKFFIQLRDGFWSIPLWFFLYYESAVVNHYLFGGSVGVYDPSFIQPIFLAGCYILAAMAIYQWILWFYYRTLHRHIWGKHRPKEGENGITINYSKKDWKDLTPWQRTIMQVSLFAVIFLGYLLVCLKLI